MKQRKTKKNIPVPVTAIVNEDHIILANRKGIIRR